MPELAQAGWGAALIAFVAGIVSFFSPCVAPLVPGYIGYLSGQTVRADDAKVGAQGDGRIYANPALRASLLFVLGFSLAFIALGVLSASIGQLLAAYQLVLETIAGIVMVIMGAFLLDLLPRSLLANMLREGRMHLRPETTQRLGLIGPVVFGVVFAAGWTPCIGPVLASILAYVSATGSQAAGAGLLAMYSLGFSVPFLAVGMGWSQGLRALGWVKRYGGVITRASGVVLILVGIVYLTGQVAIFASWAQQFAPKI